MDTLEIQPVKILKPILPAIYERVLELIAEENGTY